MGAAGRHDLWCDGDAYEPYVGRWSRPVAWQFLAWLDVPAGASWLDVGCGTGALTQVALAVASPSTVVGVARSDMPSPIVIFAAVVSPGSTWSSTAMPNTPTGVGGSSVGTALNWTTKIGAGAFEQAGNFLPVFQLVEQLANALKVGRCGFVDQVRLATDDQDRALGMILAPVGEASRDQLGGGGVDGLAALNDFRAQPCLGLGQRQPR